MNEHITQWLGAYHDGELRGAQLERVEAHLKSCADCRADLARLESLSALLAESPAPAGLKPAAQFVAEVHRRIPVRPEPTRWGRAMRTSWRLTPAALIGVLIFLQTTNLVGLAGHRRAAAGTRQRTGKPVRRVGHRLRRQSLH